MIMKKVQFSPSQERRIPPVCVRGWSDTFYSRVIEKTLKSGDCGLELKRQIPLHTRIMNRSNLWLKCLICSGTIINSALALDGQPPDFLLPEYLAKSGNADTQRSRELYKAGEFAKALPGLLSDYRSLRQEEGDPDARTSSEMQALLLFIGQCFAGLGDFAQGETALLWYREISERRWGLFDRRGGLQPAMWLAEFYDRIGNFNKSLQLRTDAFGTHYGVDWEAPDAQAQEASFTKPRPFKDAVKLLKRDLDFAGNEQIRGYEMFLEITEDRIRRGSDSEARQAADLLDEVVALIPNDREVSRWERYEGVLLQARYLLRLGRPEAAIRLIEEARAPLEGEDKTLGANASALLLAEAALVSGDTASARRHLSELPTPLRGGERDKAKEIEFSLLLEDNNPSTLRPAQAAFEQSLLQLTREVLTISSEEQRIRYFRQLKPCALPLALDDAMGVARNLLRYKGLVLDSLLEDARARMRSTDPALRGAESDLLRARQEAHRLLRISQSEEVEEDRRRAASEQYQQALASLDQIESALARQASGYGLVRSALAQTPEALLEKLPAGSCLVDFGVAHRYAGRGRYTPVYVAVRYWQGGITLRVIEDFEAVNRAIDAVQAAMLEDKPGSDPVRQVLTELHRLLIGDLLQPLPQGTTLYVSPDGALNFVPFAALLQPDGTPLIQNLDIALATSARELTGLRPPSRVQSAFLMGDPDYQASMASRGSTRAAPGSVGVERWRSARIELPPLPGTRAEVESLDGILRGCGVSVQTRLGGEATEQALRQNAAASLIHIATHGTVLESAGDDSFSPMTSGIVLLSGAQQTLNDWRRGMVADPAADGIVSAQEFSQMNLGGVDILILSACETARGKAEQGEGVLGLRRGLHQGGVKQLVLTLWPIEDQATVQVMRHFYQLMGGEPVSAVTALAAAQRETLAKWTRESGFGHAVKVAAPFVVSLGGASLEAAPTMPLQAFSPVVSSPPVPVRPPPASIAMADSDRLQGERFPQTRLRVLDTGIVSTWSDADLRYALNEMFARHGATFPRDTAVQQRFESMPWYQPRPGRTYDEIESDFNEFEQQNVLVFGAVRNARKNGVAAVPDALPGERFPVTRTRLLTLDELASWSYGDLRYAINEMFARRGVVFKEDKITRVFVGKSWYQPRPGVSYDDVELEFSTIEQANVKTLGRARDARNAR